MWPTQMAVGPDGISNKLLKEFAPKLGATNSRYLQSLIKVARNSFQHNMLMGRYNHSLSLDATIMVSKNCPTIGEHVIFIFLTQ